MNKEQIVIKSQLAEVLKTISAASLNTWGGEDLS